ncbi:hypothetical protein LCGC14_0452600 [marine sediment metagenome]|uniref:Uncharacterized protein n=1 Tax=marine sediment metagenome TaxID=412755 RepID=A0A0F9SMQ8_9ZZZZ
MTRSALVLCGVLAAMTLAGNASAAEVKDPKFLELVERLEQAGEQWLAGTLEEKAERTLQKQLKSLRYDSESLDDLRAALNRPITDDTVALYVSTRLIKGLMMSSPQVAAEGAPIVVQVHQRRGTFKPLKQYDKKMLARLAEPVQGPDETDDPFALRRQLVEDRRQEKLQEDRLVKIHNSQVTRLQKQTIYLMLLADQRAYDEKLLDWMAVAEKKRLWSYAIILGGIRSASETMTRDRAAWFYGKLMKIWRPRDTKKYTYTDPGEVTLEAAANSAFATHDDRPARRVLQTINILATQAKLPAVKVPARPRRSRSRR